VDDELELEPEVLVLESEAEVEELLDDDDDPPSVGPAGLVVPLAIWERSEDIADRTVERSCRLCTRA
jgi:hypothetical protein